MKDIFICINYHLPPAPPPPLDPPPKLPPDDPDEPEEPDEPEDPEELLLTFLGIVTLPNSISYLQFLQSCFSIPVPELE